MDVLDHDLESIEAASLGHLDFSTETLQQVLVDNAVRGSEESKDVRDEVTLIVVQTVVPVVQVLRQVDFFGSPERRLSLLVHLPNLHRERMVSPNQWRVDGKMPSKGA